jgi:hypothetical protein
MREIELNRQILHLSEEFGNKYQIVFKLCQSYSGSANLLQIRNNNVLYTIDKHKNITENEVLINLKLN